MEDKGISETPTPDAVAAVYTSHICDFIIGIIFLGLFMMPMLGLFILILGMYLLADLAASIYVSMQSGRKFIPLMMLVYFTLHFSYGLGFLVGLVKVYKPMG